MAASTLPADTHEIACSVLRPPKRMATRGRGRRVTQRPYPRTSSAVVGADGTDQVRPPVGADAHVGSGVGSLDHLAAADDHADVVDRVGVIGVGSEEHEVTGPHRRGCDASTLLPL